MRVLVLTTVVAVEISEEHSARAFARDRVFRGEDDDII